MTFQTTTSHTLIKVNKQKKKNIYFLAFLPLISRTVFSAIESTFFFFFLIPLSLPRTTRQPRWRDRGECCCFYTKTDVLSSGMADHDSKNEMAAASIVKKPPSDSDESGSSSSGRCVTLPEHPVAPEFNPNFEKMVREFRDQTRSNQPEEWDWTCVFDK